VTRTRVAAAGLGLLGLGLALPFLVAGCAGPYGGGAAVSFGYASRPGRPHPRYYCADCHGVRYFDPYYDLCMRYGYRFDWRSSPDVVDVYRRDYVAIRRADPHVGKYRYPRGARESARKRFADENGRMPQYGGAARPEAVAPQERRESPPRGPKVTPKEGTHDLHREKAGPPRGKTGRGETKKDVPKEGSEGGTPS
jgi:hypothetical protein